MSSEEKNESINDETDEIDDSLLDEVSGGGKNGKASKAPTAGGKKPI